MKQNPHPESQSAFLYLTEGFGDISFHLPVHSPPHSEAVVIRLGCNVLPHWIPREPFHQTSVSSQTCHHFWKNRVDKNSLSVWKAPHTGRCWTLNCPTEERWWMSSTWEFASVPNDNGVVHTAGSQPDIVGWPWHIHHICKWYKSLVTSLFFDKYCFFCGHLTASVVPQDSDTPPLFHISQLITGSKHSTWTNQSTQEGKHVWLKKFASIWWWFLVYCKRWINIYSIFSGLCMYIRRSLPHHDQFVISSWCQVQPVVGPTYTVYTRYTKTNTEVKISFILTTENWFLEWKSQ